VIFVIVIRQMAERLCCHAEQCYSASHMNEFRDASKVVCVQRYPDPLADPRPKQSGHTHFQSYAVANSFLFEAARVRDENIKKHETFKQKLCT